MFKWFDIIKLILCMLISAVFTEVRSVRKTKIVCTLGPSTDKGDVLKKLMLEGMVQGGKIYET